MLWRLIKAIGNLFSITAWKAALGIEKAAEDQLTSDPAAIEAVLDEAGNELIAQTETLVKEVGDIETALEELRQNRDEARKKKEAALTRMKGAVAVCANEKETQEERDKAKAKGLGYKAEAKQFAEEEESFVKLIAEQEALAAQLETHLSEMTRKVQALSATKKAKLARFNLANRLIEANKRRMNLIKTTDTSKVDAVDDKLKQLEGEARVTTRLTGVLNNSDDEKYMKAGQDTDAGDDFDTMVAQQKSKNTAKEQAAGDKPVVPEKREKI